MRKITKTLLAIGGAFCLIGVLLFGIGFASGGTKYVHATDLNSMNATSDRKSSANRFNLKKTELSDFTSLDVNLKDSDLNIKESPNEKSYIEYAQATKDKKDPVSYSVENGTLTLKEAGNTGASYHINVDISFLQAALSSKNMSDYKNQNSNYENYVTLYLPKDKLISSAKIYLGYGDFYAKNAAFDAADIKLGDGDFYAKNAAFDTANIKLDDGDFDADTFTANSGKLTFSYGDCDLQKAALGNVSLISKDGDLSVDELTLLGKTQITLSYGDADITLNNSTKKVSGFDLATHYGTITASNLKGNITTDEDDDINTFQADSKDGKTNLAIDSKDGDITIK